MKIPIHLVAGMSLFSTMLSAAPLRYCVESVGGRDFRVAYLDGNAGAANKAGQIGGSTDETVNGFFYSPGKVSWLAPFADWDFVVSGINDRGDVVGSAFGSSRGPQALISEGVVTNLTALTGGRLKVVNGINNRREILGTLDGSEIPSRAAIYADGRLTILPAPGFRGASGAAINDRGEVAGTLHGFPFDIYDGSVRHAFLFQNGATVDLGVAGGFTSSMATAISRNGDVAGNLLDGSTGFPAGQRAFRYSRGRMLDLGVLEAGDSSGSIAAGINARGQVVGTSTINPGAGFGREYFHHGFLWMNGIMRDVNDFIAPSYGVTIGQALAINDEGVITATDADFDETGHLYLLRPQRSGIGRPRIVCKRRMVVHRSRAVLPCRVRGQVSSVTYNSTLSPIYSFATGTHTWVVKPAVARGSNIVTLVAHGPGGDSRPVTVIVIRR